MSSCFDIRLPTLSLPCFCRGDDEGNWETVTVRKYYDAPNQAGERRGEEFTAVRDRETGDLYLNVPQAVVWWKCAVLATFSVGYFAIVGCFRVAVLITHLAQATLFRGCCDEPPTCEQIFTDLTNVGATPLYWLVFEAAAIVGVVAPIVTLGAITPWDMRRMLASTEKAFHGGISYQHQLGTVKPDGTRRGPTESVLTYLANCMQVRGNTTTLLLNGQPQYRRV